MVIVEKLNAIFLFLIALGLLIAFVIFLTHLIFREKTVSKKGKYKGESIKHLFSEEGLLSWKGRRNRKTFIILGFLKLIFEIFVYISTIKIVQFFHNSAGIFFVLLWVSIILIGQYIATVNAIKRLHDINITGLWIVCLGVVELLLLFINPIFYKLGYCQEILPVMNKGMNILLAILGWFMILKKGTVGPNKYGSDPLVEVGNVEKIETEKQE